MSIDRVINMIRFRKEALSVHLAETAPETGLDQHHLDAGRPEQAYWHHGYQTALLDILELLNSHGAPRVHKSGTSTSNH